MAAATAPYAAPADVTNVLGSIGSRLPAWVDVATFLSTAHAEVVDRLSRVYREEIPAFEGDAATIVRYVEARVAAAAILDAIRVNLPDLGDAPTELRASAYASIEDGVVGYPADATVTPGVDDGAGGTTPAVVTVPGPRVSSFTPLSAFPDPYADARDPSVSWQ